MAEAGSSRLGGDTRPSAPRRGQWLRVVLILLVGVGLVPAVLPFTVELSEMDRVCVPIAHGWKADRAKPSEADLQEVVDSLTAGMPSPEAMRDPTQHAAWLAAEEARTSTAGYRRAESYIDWVSGPGACVPESRHRLILSAAIAIVAAMAVTAGVVRRRRAR